MNILKHKSWHVRTIKNIARVREDEAKAAEEEKERKRRILLAEQEARTAILRQRSRDKFGSANADSLDQQASCVKDEDKVFESEPVAGPLKHVNLFEDLEDGNVVSTKVNTDHEKEKKEEREKYEKQVGYLTYLGQDTVELTGNVSWYDKMPTRSSEPTESKESSSKLDSVSKSKLRTDPLNDIRRYLKTKEGKTNDHLKSRKDLSVEPTTSRKRKRTVSEQSSPKRKKKAKKHKNKKHSHKKSKRSRSRTISDSDEEIIVQSQKVDIDQLRADRLKRELAEKNRAEKLLSKLRGDPEPEEKVEEIRRTVKQKYNSQFNPDLAKQNYKQDDKPYMRRK